MMAIHGELLGAEGGKVMSGKGGDTPDRPTCACLGREIELYGQVLEKLERVCARRLKVAVFSCDHNWTDLLAARLADTRVYHVNGQLHFPVPDVVIAEEQTGPLTRAATVVELRDYRQAADVPEVEAVRQTAQQALPGPFRYGGRGRYR